MQDSVVADDMRKWLERNLAHDEDNLDETDVETVEDDTDGTDEDYNVDVHFRGQNHRCVKIPTLPCQTGACQWQTDLHVVTCRARLGPRTHRGKERFPVMTVTCALLQIVRYRRCQFDLVFNAMCDDTCSAASFTSEGRKLMSPHLRMSLR